MSTLTTGSRTRPAIAAVAGVLLWAGLAYDVSRPVEPKGYLRSLVQAAESAHDATQTGRLLGEQELAGHVTGLFATTGFDDAAKALAGAQQKFAGQAPPDDRSAALRDQLGPLLAQSVTALGDTTRATDHDQLRDGIHRLDALAGRLEDFVEAHS